MLTRVLRLPPRFHTSFLPKAAQGDTESSSCLLQDSYHYEPPHYGFALRAWATKALMQPAVCYRGRWATGPASSALPSVIPNASPAPCVHFSSGQEAEVLSEICKSVGHDRPKKPNQIKPSCLRLTVVKPRAPGLVRAWDSCLLTERAWNSQRSHCTGHRQGGNKHPRQPQGFQHQDTTERWESSLHTHTLNTAH